MADKKPDTADHVLTEKEQLYLNAVQLNQKTLVEELMNDPEVDPCCVDYMGRGALILSIWAGNIDLIDMLLYRLEKKNFSAIEDALLYAVSLEKTHIVKLIIDHPSYILNEKTYALVRSRLGQVHRSEERSQFSPDITPLMLAAHRNNHEIVQVFLSRGQNIDPPHLDICSCLECKAQREDDSLMFERSRLNTYRAFASPAFMALTFSDPVKEAFALSQTLRQYSLNHKEFKGEYLELAEQCMNFAIEIMNLCRSAKEVNAMLSDLAKEKNRTVIDPLAVIKDALKYGEKQFISQPNCQMHCMKYFYQQLAFIQHLNLGAKLALLLMFAPLILPLSLIYIIYPNFQIIVPKVGHNDSTIVMPVKRLLNCPAVKFLSHSLSYIFFLSMLIWATFRVESMIYSYEDSDATWEEKAMLLWRFDIRDSNNIVSALQWCIIGWLFGHFWMECKEIYNLGAHNYLQSYYNVLDSLSMMLYVASFACRIVAASKVSTSHQIFADQLAMMRSILFNETVFFGNYNDTLTGKLAYKSMRFSLLESEQGYWLRGCRSWWLPDDPEIVSDCCFAIANWLSFARATFMMLAWEALGPLQISLSRMVSQIARFITILVLFLLAFVVAMTNLYWYYAKDVDITNAVNANDFHVKAVDRNKMGNLRSTLANLYWTLFGMTDTDITETEPHEIYADQDSSFYYNEDYTIKTSTNIMDAVGTLMFATYTGFMIIILMNMLIATMSHQYEVVQTASDAEWRYARCNLWMWYIDQEGCLPVPLNLLPDRKTFKHLKFFFCKLFCLGGGSSKPKRREDSHGGPQIAKRLQYNPQSFADALEGAKKKGGQKQEDVLAKLKSNLRRRFLFHLQGMRDDSATDRRYQQLGEGVENGDVNNDVFNGMPNETPRLRTASVSGKADHANANAPELMVRPTGSVIFGVLPKEAPPARQSGTPSWPYLATETSLPNSRKPSTAASTKSLPQREDSGSVRDADANSNSNSNLRSTAESSSSKKGSETSNKKASARNRAIERLLMPASMRKRFLGSDAPERSDSQSQQDKRATKLRFNSESNADAKAGTADQLSVKPNLANRNSAPAAETEIEMTSSWHEQFANPVDPRARKYSEQPVSSRPPYPLDERVSGSPNVTPATLTPTTLPPPIVPLSPTKWGNCPYPLVDLGVPPLPDTAIDVIASGSPGLALGTVFEESNNFGFADTDESSMRTSYT